MRYSLLSPFLVWYCQQHVVSLKEILPCITADGIVISMVKDIGEGHLNVTIGTCHANLHGPLDVSHAASWSTV